MSNDEQVFSLVFTPADVDAINAARDAEGNSGIGFSLKVALEAHELLTRAIDEARRKQAAESGGSALDAAQLCEELLVKADSLGGFVVLEFKGKNGLTERWALTAKQAGMIGPLVEHIASQQAAHGNA